MKPVRWIIALAVAVIALCAVYFVVDHKADDRERHQQLGAGKTLFSFDASSISRVTLESEDGYFAFDWDAVNATWQLASADQFSFNTYAISTICNYFSELSSEKTVVFDCQDTAVYGFDAPTVLKVYTTDKGEEAPYVLYVGDSTPTYDAYYAMLPDSNDVYTIGYTQGSIFCADKNMLKNTYLFDTFSTLVDAYQLIRDGETVFSLERDSDALWQMTYPRPYTVHASNITNLMDSLVRVQVDSFVEENPTDLAKYGLDKPRYVLKLRGTINGNAVSRELLFGNMITENDNETQMYGYISDSKQVFIVTKAAVSFLEQDTTAYILPYCVDVSIEDLSKIEINMGTVYDLHETLYLDYANEQYALGDIDIDAYEDENILTLYQNFYRAVANLQFSAMDLDAVPEGEAAVTILYMHLDGSVTSAEFVPKAENDFYLVVNGEYTGLTVLLNRFTGSAGMVFSYEALLKGLKDAK
ncbi:MAG: DUF4340 domain-containing protein [Oscillospiraceae bacterium]